MNIPHVNHRNLKTATLTICIGNNFSHNNLQVVGSIAKTVKTDDCLELPNS